MNIFLFIKKRNLVIGFKFDFKFLSFNDESELNKIRILFYYSALKPQPNLIYHKYVHNVLFLFLNNKLSERWSSITNEKIFINI